MGPTVQRFLSAADQPSMQRMRSLPSFSFLLTCISLLLLIPLTTFGVVRWREADARYDAALEVQARAERTQVLLRLTPALNQEELSSVWEGGGSGLLDDVPATGGELLVPDFGASLEFDRALVDSLISSLGDDSITDAVLDVRADASAGEVGFFEFAGRYEEVIRVVEDTLATELLELNAAATEVGASSVIQAARVAEASAGVQVVTAGQETRWAQLTVAPVLDPILSDAIAFADSVAVFEERVANLERVAPSGTRVGDAWIEVRDSRSALQMRQSHAGVVRQFAGTGIDPTRTRATELDADDLTLSELLVLAADLKAGLDDAKVFATGLADVVELSLADVDRSASEAVNQAAGERLSISLWTVVFSALISGASLALVIMVGRPVKRMANTARRLSKGQLDARLRETGPTEVRMGARALNEALASVRIAEAQAVALAEERLDAEVLKQRAPGELGKSLQAAVSRLASSLAERDNFQRRLEHEATHDHLTTLSNRAAILRHLHAAIARTRRSKGALALLFLDVDDFKAINDTHGHHAGDIVLKTISERLVEAIREGDLAGRMGGDEFVVVAEPIHDMNAALKLSNRILARVNDPITVDGVTFHPSMSVGVGLTDFMGTMTAEELLRDADSAVYRAKEQGKGRVEVCDESLRLELKEREALEQAIREAIDNDELVLHYQPSVHAADRDIIGVEALVRWNRPDVGLVYPDGFIPAAERTDLILDIDRWVIDAAISQAAAWSDVPSLSGISVAVNISARHLGSGTLLDDVGGVIEEHGLRAGLLTLEVTETALLEDLETAARELRTLQELGVSIALDDFGTGFMSLAHLRELPVDVLKIDRSFVSQIESHADHSLVQLIVDTGHLLGVTITGEGIETETQARVLQEMGVDHLQGYYFSRPVPADDLLDVARQQRTSTAITVP